MDAVANDLQSSTNDRKFATPHMLNPIVDTIFGCQDPSNFEFASTFKNIFGKNFILLVPPTELMPFVNKLALAKTKEKSKSPKYCSREFLESHILIPVSKEYVQKGKEPQAYVLLADRKNLVDISNCELRYKAQTRKILYTQYLPISNDYFHNKSHILLLHIDQCMNFEQKGSNTSVSQNLKLANKDSEQTSLQSSKHKFELVNQEIASFELLLRLNPKVQHELKNKISRECAILEHTSFHKIFDMASVYFRALNTIIEWCLNEPFFEGYKQLGRMVYKYVEAQFCNMILKKLHAFVKEPGSNICETSPEFVNLSFTDIPSFSESLQQDFIMSTRKMLALEKNLSNAIPILQKMFASKNCDTKSDYLLSALQELSRSQDADADILVGLLILCICRASPKNVYAELLYLQNFMNDTSKITFGSNAYAISTLEVAIKYLVSPENNSYLMERSVRNKEFWSILQNGTYENFTRFIESRNVLEVDDILFGRNYACKSCFSLMVENKGDGHKMFSHIMLGFPQLKAIDITRLLDDRGANNETLLSKSVKLRNDSFTNLLVEVLLSVCTAHEIELYVNTKECDTDRTVAHYIGLDCENLLQLGHYFDWETLDNQSHTPLFALFRFYDHVNYNTLVDHGFRTCLFWYRKKQKQFNFSTHMDTKGNTLLHIAKSNVAVLLSGLPNPPVNQQNRAGLTPLMFYCRYSRVENIKTLIESGKKALLHVRSEGNQKYLGYSCFDFAKNEHVLRVLGKYLLSIKDIVGKTKILALRCEKACWYVYLVIKSSENNVEVVKHKLKTLKAWVSAYFTRHPKSFLLQSKNFMEVFPDALVPLSGIFAKFELDKKLINWGQIITAINIIQPDFLKALLSANDAHMFDQFSRSNAKYNALAQFSPSRTQKIQTTPEELYSFKSVLKVSLEECEALQHYLKAMKQLLVVKMVKRFDLEYVESLLFVYIFNKKKSQQELYCHIFNSEYFDALSISCVSFLLECLSTIVVNLQGVLHGSFVNWWKVYGDYLQLQRKLYDVNASLSPTKHMAIARATNEDMAPTTTNNSHTVCNETSSKFSSFFDNYFEGNKRKYREKLITDINLEAQRFKAADIVLREDYKNIAEEMSKFMTMKDTFFHSYCIVETAASNTTLFC